MIIGLMITENQGFPISLRAAALINFPAIAIFLINKGKQNLKLVKQNGILMCKYTKESWNYVLQDKTDAEVYLTLLEVKISTINPHNHEIILI